MGHRHFNYNPDELTTCQICKKKVKLRNINSHNRKHFWNAKGPYKCFVCSKKFTRKKYCIHIKFEHQEATGKYFRPTTAPPPKTPIVKIDFVKELKRMRGNQNWIVLKKRKFALLYDDVNHTPVGGLEHLTKEDLQDNIGVERDKLYPDPEVSNPVPPNGFTTFNRVQGHVVPNRNYKLRPEDNYDTQSTANTIPQLSEVNSGAVHQVEDLQRDLLDFWDEGIFLTGPIYDRTSPKHAAINNLLVYDLESTFKISLVRREGEQPRLQVFIIPNDYSGMPFWYHRSTIEEVERRTGLRLDLFRECLYMWNQLVEVHRCRLSGCDACFADKQGLSNHLENHMFPCPTCRKIFQSNEARKAHIKENHRKQTCKICGRVVYGKQAQLTAHMLTHNKNRDKPFSCPQCAFKTCTRSDLNRHLIHVHSNKRNHICETCGHAAKTSGDLTQHKKIHVDFKITCQICGERFRQKSAFKRHYQMKHDPSFVPEMVRCETCGEKFKGKHQLGHHVNKVHLNLPYVCSCGRTYTKQKTLTWHQKKCNTHKLSSSTAAPNVADSQNEVVASPNQLVKPGATSQIHSVSESSNADVANQNGRKITSNDPVISRPASVSPPPSSTSSSPLAAAASINQLVKCIPNPSSVSQDDLQTDGRQASSSSQQITTVRIRRRPDPSKKRKILSRNRSNKRRRVIEDDDDDEFDSDNQSSPVNLAASVNQPVSKRPSSPPGSSGSKDMLQPPVVQIDDDDEDEPVVSRVSNVPSATPASSTMTSANYVPSSNQLVSVSDALKMLMANRGGQLLPPQPRKRATPGAYSLSKAAIKRGKYSDPKQPKLMVFMGEEEKNEKEEKNKKEKDKKERKKKK